VNFPFNLSQATDSASYTAIFDLYWIRRATLQWFCTTPPGSLNGVSDLILAPEFTNTVPTSLGGAYTWGSAKTKAMTSGTKFSITVAPRFYVTVSGSQASEATWCNIAATNTPWYGVVYTLTQGSVAVTTYNLVVWLDVCFYNIG
jgi:hypothetical protein